MLATESRPRSAPVPQRTLPQTFFRTLNQFLEPIARDGWFSPEFLPTGLILLETTGRRSGRVHQTPVLAMLADGHLIIRTIRGERSDWFKNLRANPDIAYYIGGNRREARALVHTPSDHCPTGLLPPPVALAVSIATMAVEMLGWRFAILAPRDG